MNMSQRHGDRVDKWIGVYIRQGVHAHYQLGLSRNEPYTLNSG